MNSYNVKLFKLITGEEFIAQVIKERNGFEIANPVVAVQAEADQLQFVPWVPMAARDVKIVILYEHVVLCINTHESLAKAHKDQFDESRIITPNIGIVKS